MASRILQMKRDRTGLAFIAGANEGKVTGYIRLTCALNLQNISKRCLQHGHSHLRWTCPHTWARLTWISAFVYSPVMRFMTSIKLLFLCSADILGRRSFFMLQKLWTWSVQGGGMWSFQFQLTVNERWLAGYRMLQLVSNKLHKAWILSTLVWTASTWHHLTSVLQGHHGRAVLLYADWSHYVLAKTAESD